jgi:hypothetical protein
MLLAQQDGKELVTVKNPLTPEQVAQTFVEACWWSNLQPTNELINMLLAHSALETAHWKWLRCFNFGNVKATSGWIASGGDYCFYVASENLSDQVAQAWLKLAKPRTDGVDGLDMIVRSRRADGRLSCWFYPSHPVCRFRAFETALEGGQNYVQKLLGKYATALAWAKAGNVDMYVKEIHRLGYFTAGFNGYLRVMRYQYNKYRSTKVSLADPIELIGNEIHGTRSGDWKRE